MRPKRALHATLLALVLFTTVLSAVSADDDDDRCRGKKKKGCQVPEVPYSAVLPAATMAGITGFYFVQRRRSTPASVEADEAK